MAKLELTLGFRDGQMDKAIPMYGFFLDRATQKCAFILNVAK